MLVRQSTATDGTLLRSLRIAALTEAPPAFGARLDDMLALPRSHFDAAAARHATSDEATSFLALDQADPVGTIGAFFEAESGRAFICALWVAPAYRGAGVAALLLAATRRWLAARSARSIWAWVADSNARAIAFYLKHGFSRNGDSQALPSNPDQFEHLYYSKLTQPQMPLAIDVDPLTSPAIISFLEDHIADMHKVSPPESTHALDLAGLRHPDITCWSGWLDGDLVGCTAIRRLDDDHAELKSMRTSPRHRQRGIATGLLQHALAHARQAGYRRISLETGSMAFFEPARALYLRHGFTPCDPFADYQLDPNSVFMTRAL
ncbi:GNAT family N-acetyltransferase [Chitinolyticbacter albus]|uniref:GNAT family N-acetyltransferase n=1 Tax=Chitinolyticbacter albus TaxID=2961951 RepID=UPI00210C25B9|nr:GNAT family N-acetyltransferase [Chitinolyticbacter albus]